MIGQLTHHWRYSKGYVFVFGNPGSRIRVTVFSRGSESHGRIVEVVLHLRLFRRFRLRWRER